jgi:hypothetical protein
LSCGSVLKAITGVVGALTRGDDTEPWDLRNGPVH